MEFTFHNIYIHLVFSTKHRSPLIDPAFEEELYCYIQNHSYEYGIWVRAIGGTADHIHALIDIPPAIGVSRAAQIIKGSSSRWINKYHLKKTTFRWQRGFAAFSLHRSMINATIRYIHNQKEHHRQVETKKEFEILKRDQDIRNCI